jgi:glycopeptide antibiotics resistance protein
MKNLVFLLVILVVIAAAAFSGYTGVVLAASQSEGTIPQSGDLCGGTGGNGQIVSVGNKAFTIKRKDDGRNQIIHLTTQATIETLTGSVSLSNLKKGDRVTLVGGPNRDGSFTADTVVVCSGTQGNRIGQATPLTLRKTNTAYKSVSGVINILTVVLFGLIWLGIVAFLRLKKKKSLVYLLFFTIFYIYLYKVLDYTLWQFQSLLLLKHFIPDLMLSGLRAGKSVNLIPLVTLKLEDARTSLLNILLMMPFGFGLPFVANFRIKKVVFAGLFLSIIIEFLQFMTGFMANMTFRVADVNDVIFNTLGVAIGYMLFVGFVRNYRQIFGNSKISANPILRYIADRPQVDK